MKVKLKSVELVEENNQFYLYAIYNKEENGIKSEIHIPRIEIPFVRRDIDGDSSPRPYGNVTISTCNYDGYNQEVSIDLGKGELPLRKFKSPYGPDVFYWEQTLEKEMTVEDIEKALGHPVKIVGEERTDE